MGGVGRRATVKRLTKGGGEVDFGAREHEILSQFNIGMVQYGKSQEK